MSRGMMVTRFAWRAQTLEGGERKERVSERQRGTRTRTHVYRCILTVCVLHNTDKVGFRRLLQCPQSRCLEAKVGSEVLSDLTDKSLEGKLHDEEIGGLLVATDLTKSDCSWSESLLFARLAVFVDPLLSLRCNAASLLGCHGVLSPRRRIAHDLQ